MTEETEKQLTNKSEKCRQFYQDLAAYLEGETKPRVPAHARECASCRTVLDDLEQIRRLSRQLPLAEPLPTVWASIRAALEAEGALREPGSAWRRWVRDLTFSVKPAPMTVLASAVILGSLFLVSPGGLRQPEVSGWFSVTGGAPVAEAVILQDEADLARTVREVESIYRAREAFFEPTLKATYEESLESLNRSIRECLEALRQEPANTLVREYLYRAYTQKAEVLAFALEFDTR